MSRPISYNEKLEFCKASKDSFYEVWQEFVAMDIPLSSVRKEEYFNKKFIDIIRAFINQKPEVSCDENIVPEFLEWLEKQPSVPSLEILMVFDPKTALLWDCSQFLSSSKPIDKKIRDKYKISVPIAR